jgi:hypothetical protein
MLQIKKRISLTFNQKQLLDAQILAACDAVGGDIGDLLKLFALRGIMADPAMLPVIAQGAANASEARKIKGAGFNPKNISAQKADIPSTFELVSIADPVVVESILPEEDAVSEPSIILPDVKSMHVAVVTLASATAPTPSKTQAAIDSASYVSPVTGSPVDDYQFFIFNEPELS